MKQLIKTLLNIIIAISAITFLVAFAMLDSDTIVPLVAWILSGILLVVSAEFKRYFFE